MKSIKGTETEKNLLKSFAGESQARSRYKFFASKARKEGYEQIAAVFEETAEQEKEHAERFFKFLEGGMVALRWMIGNSNGLFNGVIQNTPMDCVYRSLYCGTHHEGHVDSM